MDRTLRVTIWNEFRHEKRMPSVKELYPDGMHAVIGSFLEKDNNIKVTLAALDDPMQGLPDEVLDNTDVLIWWGHAAHNEVDDDLVERIRKRIYLGEMGLIVLHSGHHSKVFRGVIGTTGNLSWGREQKEILWNIAPTHPIMAGVPDHFTLESEELYAEPFYIGEPDELLLCGWYEDGFVMRSGAVFKRSAGKIFYFQPGHETCPTYYNEYVERIIHNAVWYVAPAESSYPIERSAPHWTWKATEQ